jgi:hypothetical protein
MASTFSPSLRIELIGDGDQSGIWGQTTNNNLGALIEQAIAGVVTITMVDTNYTMTNFNGVADEARNQVLVLEGTNTAQRNLIAPLIEKTYTIKNTTTGGFSVQIIGSSGVGVVIPNGVTTTVYCDGLNFYPSINGIVGNLVVTGNATIAGNLSVTGTNSIIPTGTRMPFAQAAAPTGFTQVTDDTATNRMLRVVNTAGGGTGGSASPILMNVVPSHTHGFTTGGQSANHVHGGTTGGQSADHSHNINTNQGQISFFAQSTGGGPAQSGFTGGVPVLLVSPTTSGTSNDHNHNFTTGGVSTDHNHSGTTDNGSSQTNWAPRYIDMIICAKN